MARRLTVIALLMATCDATAQHPPVEALLAEARANGADGTTTYAERRVLGRALEKHFFASLFAAAREGRVEKLGQAAHTLGFRLVQTRDGSSPVVVVLEDHGRRRGAGAWVIRLGPVASETFIQAPHTFSDLGSLGMAIELFRASGARALGVNTMHRRGRSGLQATTEEGPVPGDFDVAHRTESTFQTVTLAWLVAGHANSLVQVHGYADERVPWDLVLSAGDGGPAPAWAQAAGTALAAALPEARVAVHPEQCDRLGGTENVQGRAVRAHGARFMHLELSASLRRRLKQPREGRAFFEALATIINENR